MLTNPPNLLVAVIVAYSRPEMVGAVWANFDRQLYPHKCLIIVENGRAVGTWRRLAPTVGARVITSSEHQSDARNEGLEQARRMGFEYFAFFDDDDYYGPAYLDEALRLAKRGRVVGKQRHFVWFADTKRFVLLSPHYHDCVAVVLNGPSLTGWTADAEAFDRLDVGEEVTWCMRMKKRGHELWTSSVRHLLYMRRGDAGGHTWRETSERIEAQNAGGVYLGDRIDLAVVNGQGPIMGWKGSGEHA